MLKSIDFNELLGNIKRFDRCSVSVHQFCNCSVTQDIQTTPISKAEERDSMRLELEEGLDEYLSNDLGDDE